jgi:hypothetical protein
MEAALTTLGRGDEISHPAFLSLLAAKENASPRADADRFLSRAIRQRSTWQPLLVSLGLMFFSQATGFNTVLGYAKLIFIESNLGPAMHEDDAMGLTAGLILITCGLAIGLSKVAPRRVLLLCSAAACCLTLALLGTYYYLKQAGFPVASFAWTPVAALMSLIVSHMCGYGAVAWTVIVEILPEAVRSRIFPLLVAFNCVTSFGFALSFRHVENLAGYHVVFWIHAALTALGVVVIALCVPETRDRTEQEIAAFFRRADETKDSEDGNSCCCSCDLCSNSTSPSTCCQSNVGSYGSTAISIPINNSSAEISSNSSTFLTESTAGASSHTTGDSRIDIRSLASNSNNGDNFSTHGDIASIDSRLSIEGNNSNINSSDLDTDNSNIDINNDR